MQNWINPAGGIPFAQSPSRNVWTSRLPVPEVLTAWLSWEASAKHYRTLSRALHVDLSNRPEDFPSALSRLLIMLIYLHESVVNKLT